MLENCYCPLPHLPLLDRKIVLEAITGYYAPGVPIDALPRAVYCSFKESKFCEDLLKEFGTENFRTGYQVFPPMTYYDWHIDERRNCGINFSYQ